MEKTIAQLGKEVDALVKKATAHKHAAEAARTLELERAFDTNCCCSTQPRYCPVHTLLHETAGRRLDDLTERLEEAEVEADSTITDKLEQHFEDGSDDDVNDYTSDALDFLSGDEGAGDRPARREAFQAWLCTLDECDLLAPLLTEKLIDSLVGARVDSVVAKITDAAIDVLTASEAHDQLTAKLVEVGGASLDDDLARYLASAALSFANEVVEKALEKAQEKAQEKAEAEPAKPPTIEERTEAVRRAVGTQGCRWRAPKRRYAWARLEWLGAKNADVAVVKLNEAAKALSLAALREVVQIVDEAWNNAGKDGGK